MALAVLNSWDIEPFRIYAFSGCLISHDEGPNIAPKQIKLAEGSRLEHLVAVRGRDLWRSNVEERFSNCTMAVVAFGCHQGEGLLKLLVTSCDNGLFDQICDLLRVSEIEVGLVRMMARNVIEACLYLIQLIAGQSPVS